MRPGALQNRKLLGALRIVTNLPPSCAAPVYVMHIIIEYDELLGLVGGASTVSRFGGSKSWGCHQPLSKPRMENQRNSKVKES